MKKEKNFSFRYIGEYPKIDSISKDILSFTNSDWNRYTARQKTIVGHEHTKTIPLIFDMNKKTRMIYHRDYDKLKPHLDDISKFLANMGEDHLIVRANLVLLLAGKSIKEHIDKGDFLNSSRRLHLPITTNSQCSFTVENEKKVFSIGEIWEINNTGKKHGVINGGDTDRIHLIIDVK